MSNTLRVGMTDWVAYAPFYVAKDLGYFTGSSIDITFKLDSTERYELFRAGLLDCIPTSINAFCVKAPEVDARVILGLIKVLPPGTERIVAKTSFQSLKDLQRATICFRPNGLEHFYFRYFFNQASIPFPEKVLETVNRQEMRNKFQRGLADAIVLYEPFITQFTSNGDNHVIPNEADLSVVLAVLAARKEAMEKKEGQLRVLVEGYFRALAYIKDNPEKALTLLMRYFHVDIRNPLASLKQKLEGFQYIDRVENREIFTGSDQLLYRAIEESVKVWRQIGSLTTPLDTERLIDTTFATRKSEGALL